MLVSPPHAGRSHRPLGHSHGLRRLREWSRVPIIALSARDRERDKVAARHVQDMVSPNGFAAWAEVLHRGWEGMVAKDPAAPYVGGRTLKWLKVKQPGYRVEERGWKSE
jgi:hypothetical protein